MLRNKADRATRALLREISRDNVDLFTSLEPTRSRTSSADSSARSPGMRNLTPVAVIFVCPMTYIRISFSQRNWRRLQKNHPKKMSHPRRSLQNHLSKNKKRKTNPSKERIDPTKQLVRKRHPRKAHPRKAGWPTIPFRPSSTRVQ